MTTSSDMFLDTIVELLRSGQAVRFRAPGNSMHPTIKNSETITVEPVAPSSVKVGDIILYRSKAGIIAHRVIRIETQAPNKTRPKRHKGSVQAVLKAERPILNPAKAGDPQGPKGRSSPTQSSSLSPHHFFILRGDGWGASEEPVHPSQVLGKAVSVERGGRSIDPYSTRAKMERNVQACASRLKRWIIHKLHA